MAMFRIDHDGLHPGDESFALRVQSARAVGAETALGTAIVGALAVVRAHNLSPRESLVEDIKHLVGELATTLPGDTVTGLDVGMRYALDVQNNVDRAIQEATGRGN